MVSYNTHGLISQFIYNVSVGPIYKALQINFTIGWTHQLIHKDKLTSSDFRFEFLVVTNVSSFLSEKKENLNSEKEKYLKCFSHLSTKNPTNPLLFCYKKLILVTISTCVFRFQKTRYNCYNSCSNVIGKVHTVIWKYLKIKAT